MANDLNCVMLIGRLGKDPETRSLPSGMEVCNFSIAVSASWKDRESGERKEKTTWIPCVAFDKLAGICSNYLRKGSQVFVSGEFTVRKWQDRDGAFRYNTEVVVNKMQMLGPKPDRSEAAPASPGNEAAPGGFEDDDLPF